jgi:hypothetical protein
VTRKELKVTSSTNPGLGGVLYLLFWDLLFAVGLLLMGEMQLTSPEVLFLWA